MPVRETLGAERDEGSGGVYYYRNKMEFSFSAQRWLTDAEIATEEHFDRHFALGLHVPGRFDKVLDLKTCFLQSEWSARLVNGIRDLARHEGWEPWHVREHTGWLRHLVIRTSASTEDRMVNLVTWDHNPERLAVLTAFLRLGFPEATTFVNTVNEGLANTSYGDAHTVFGPGTIRDRIGAHTFEIASNAFFQTNTRQAERLYAVAAEMADLKPTDLVYDLYCGTGTISLFVADRVARVVGVELVEEAVQNARAAAAANGVANTTFVAGDMLRLFTPEFVAEHGRPDVLIVDPPRAGIHPKVVDQIADLRPERLVYVSATPRRRPTTSRGSWSGPPMATASRPSSPWTSSRTRHTPSASSACGPSSGYSPPSASGRGGGHAGLGLPARAVVAPDQRQQERDRGSAAAPWTSTTAEGHFFPVICR